MEMPVTANSAAAQTRSSCTFGKGCEAEVQAAAASQEHVALVRRYGPRPTMEADVSCLEAHASQRLLQY
jgi:hypothetical protein